QHSTAQPAKILPFGLSHFLFLSAFASFSFYPFLFNSFAFFTALYNPFPYGDLFLLISASLFLFVRP
ncbi:hypothetical protein, partial [Conservatibacter flavescens]